uniref:Uncharacterized protein n=1 Tax=Oryza glumipatula TaxID=40148 RepID=A0A0E0AKD3_9ORYZ
MSRRSRRYEVDERTPAQDSAELGADEAPASSRWIRRPLSRFIWIWAKPLAAELGPGCTTAPARRRRWIRDREARA